MARHIALAVTDAEIAACYPVMAELRPHLEPARFVPLIRHLAGAAGLRLAFLREGEVRAVAGYRVSE